MYRVSRITNGLLVASAEMPGMTSASVGLWVAVGSRCESAELNGVCHFIEHLLFKGTKRRTARDISEAVEGIGGYLNAFTSEERTCFHCRASHARLDELVDVLMDMVLNSKFSPSDMAREREVIKEEMAMYRDQPEHHVQELLNETLWKNQPLGRPIEGTKASLDRIDRSRLLGYFRENYTAGSMLLAAAGKVKHQRLVKAVRGFARFLRPGGSVAFSRATHRQAKPEIRLFSRPAEQTQLALGIRACSRNDPRRFALRLASAILGENMSSRLFQSIRERHGLAYHVYSTPSHFADTGDLVISAGLDAKNLHKTVALILKELRRLSNTTPAPSELRRARDYVIGQMDLSLESADNQMNWVGESLLGYARILRPPEIRARLHSVSPSQIRDVLRDFFRPENLNLALVSPLKSVSGIQKLLTG
jgi:predicted Zn-dependent peptidase